MPAPRPTPTYHITDISNLPSILQTGGLLSDHRLALANNGQSGQGYTQIGYGHIKHRRMHEILVDCAPQQPPVGAFVPFYYCPRSVMLFTINNGRTGRPQGCQSSILHLVTSVDTLIRLGQVWAISDGNAGTYHTSFFNDVAALDDLDWNAINATYWSGKTHQKAAEFLVLNSVPWTAIEMIGCHNEQTALQARQIVSASGVNHRPPVVACPAWYY